MRKWALVLLTLMIGVMGLSQLVFENLNSQYVLDDQLIQQISSKVPNYTHIDQIPQNLINAVIAVEDKRFYQHLGFDVVGIGRAFLTNLKERRIAAGGSTITQQLAKNVFLTQEKSLNRKVKELLIAVKLEQLYTKEEILEMYLNVIYYGEGSYGIGRASQIYFDKPVEELTLAETTVLAGLIQAPSAYNPKRHYAKAKRRQEVVLAVMVSHGLISKESESQIKGEVIYIQ